jgi:hypothetical protein
VVYCERIVDDVAVSVTEQRFDEAKNKILLYINFDENTENVMKEISIDKVIIFFF